jgi:hypothetical protein
LYPIEKYKNIRKIQMPERLGASLIKETSSGDHFGLQKTLINKEFFLSGILVDVAAFIRVSNVLP